MDRWVLKIQALEEKEKHCEEVLGRELDGLDDEFAALKFLGQELQVRVQKVMVEAKRWLGYQMCCIHTACN